jgi:O-antigen/teichoic acid export membrane protein
MQLSRDAIAYVTLENVAHFRSVQLHRHRRGRMSFRLPIRTKTKAIALIYPKLTMASLRDEIGKLRTSSLAHNAGWMLVGQGTSLLLQAGYFILLARLLGVREYGIFAGAFAFVGIVMPYSTLGSGTLFMRYVGSGSGGFAAYWGNILISTLGVGTTLSVLLWLLAPHILNPASASIVLVVAVGNCIFNQLVACMGQIFQTYEFMRMTAILNLLINLLRLIAVAALTFVVHHATAWQWATASLVVSLLAALVGFAIVTMRYGRPKLDTGVFRSKAVEGIGFSMGGSAQSIYNDIDKTMLSHYGMNLQNGIYTMAYRVIDIATIPITAVDAAALPRYFRKSAEGVASVYELSLRLAKRAALVGICMSVCLFFMAPVIPHLVGRGFSESILALRWLCLLPIFRGMHQLTGSAITGMGFQRFRTATQFTAAGVNFGLNLWLIPQHGWLGAAWASLATDGLLVILNWTTLQGLVARDARSRGDGGVA